MAHRLRPWLHSLAIAAPVVAGDLVSKAWAVARLAGQPPMVLGPGWLRLELGINPGAAFGVLGQGPRLGPAVLGGLAVAYLSWLATRPLARSRSGLVGVGMMLGGALGNLYDRLWRVVDDGSLWGPGPRAGVVDFVVIGRWPAFNLADMALVVGALLLVVSLVRHHRARHDPRHRPSRA